MPRALRPLDPNGGVITSFAADLRALREDAGSPSFLIMHRRTGRSRTALSEAAGGDHFPSWETVEAFVTACGGDVRWWLDHWHDARDQLKSGAKVPPRPNAPAPAAAVPDAAPRPDPLRWRRGVPLPVAVILAGALLAVCGAVVYAMTRQTSGDPGCTNGPCVFQTKAGLVPLWSSSTTASTLITTLPNRTAVTMVCWIDNQRLEPPKTNYVSSR